MMNLETLRSMPRDEMIAWKQALRSNVKTLEEIKSTSDRPEETVEKLVQAIGSAAARQTVAALVNSKSSDGRISSRSRQWAETVESAPDPELSREMYIGTDRIHPAHLEQIARYMAAWTDPEPEPDPDKAPVDPASEIAPDHITVDGLQLPVEWSVSPSGKSVTAFYTAEGQRYKLVFTGSTCLDLFPVALAAARGQRSTAVDSADLMEIYLTSTPIAERKPTAPVDPDKQRHGDVPEKWFICQALEGKSWRILFDGVTGKTRVIFQRKPSEKVLQAVKAAGFYWSPSLKSWNKGLTFRAFRAAEKLHAELHAITA